MASLPLRLLIYNLNRLSKPSFIRINTNSLLIVTNRSPSEFRLPRQQSMQKAYLVKTSRLLSPLHKLWIFILQNSNQLFHQNQSLKCSNNRPNHLFNKQIAGTQILMWIHKHNIPDSNLLSPSYRVSPNPQTSISQLYLPQTSHQLLDHPPSCLLQVLNSNPSKNRIL